MVPVHITADQTVPSSLRQVRAIVTQAAATLGEADASWPASAVVDIGVYLAKSVSGSVDVVACGFDASGNPVAASATQSTTVTAGATAPQVNLVLSAGTPSALCAIAVGTGGTRRDRRLRQRRLGRRRHGGRDRQRRLRRKHGRQRRRPGGQGERRHRGQRERGMRQRQRWHGGQGERRHPGTWRGAPRPARTRAPAGPPVRQSCGRGRGRWASAAWRPPRSCIPRSPSTRWETRWWCTAGDPDLEQPLRRAVEHVGHARRDRLAQRRPVPTPRWPSTRTASIWRSGAFPTTPPTWGSGRAPPATAFTGPLVGDHADQRIHPGAVDELEGRRDRRLDAGREQPLDGGGQHPIDGQRGLVDPADLAARR